MPEISYRALEMLIALKSNIDAGYDHFLDDPEPNQNISDGLRLARLASLISEMSAQIIDFERLSGINLSVKIQNKERVE